MADMMLLYSSEEFALSQGAPPLSITTGYILYYLNPSGLVPPTPFLFFVVCGLFTRALLCAGWRLQWLTD